MVEIADMLNIPLEQRVEDLERRVGCIRPEPHVICGVALSERTVGTDHVNEVTSAHGVTIDSVNIKDGTITSLAGNDCIIVRVDKDGDGDFDPYTSSSWNGDSFSTSTGTINWNTVFGVPTGAKMVFVYCELRDSSATPNAGRLVLQAKSTTTLSAWGCYSKASNAFSTFAGWVPAAADGTSYYSITASGAGTCDIWIRISAYAR